MKRCVQEIPCAMPMLANRLTLLEKREWLMGAQILIQQILIKCPARNIKLNVGVQHPIKSNRLSVIIDIMCFISKDY